MLSVQYKTRPCRLAQKTLSLFLAVCASNMLVGLFVRFFLCVVKS